MREVAVVNAVIAFRVRLEAASLAKSNRLSGPVGRQAFASLLPAITNASCIALVEADRVTGAWLVVAVHELRYEAVFVGIR